MKTHFAVCAWIVMAIVLVIGASLNPVRAERLGRWLYADWNESAFSQAGLDPSEENVGPDILMVIEQRGPTGRKWIHATIQRLSVVDGGATVWGLCPALDVPANHWWRVVACHTQSNLVERRYLPIYATVYWQNGVWICSHPVAYSDWMPAEEDETIMHLRDWRVTRTP
jgi:hypothetical protein